MVWSRCGITAGIDFPEGTLSTAPDSSRQPIKFRSIRQSAYRPGPCGPRQGPCSAWLNRELHALPGLFQLRVSPPCQICPPPARLAIVVAVGKVVVVVPDEVVYGFSGTEPICQDHTQAGFDGSQLSLDNCPARTALSLREYCVLLLSTKVEPFGNVRSRLCRKKSGTSPDAAFTALYGCRCGDSVRACRCGKFPVQGGERNLHSHCQFKIHGIVDAKSVPLGERQYGSPNAG